jgi:ribosome-associated heat shock protein Hsp15
MESKVRVDKWLWAVRIYKTRSQAAEACRKGRISIGNLPVKPSHEVAPGDVVKVRRPPITRSYKVLVLTDKRVSAKIAADCVKDITPPEELEIIETQKQMSWMYRERGSGRPTKKDRRNLDEYFDM